MDVPVLLTLRHVRLMSGLVMFAYLVTHLVNHALGIFSLSLAENALNLALVFWRNPVVTALLYGSAAVHFALALRTLYSRREWHLPLIEIMRLAAGFGFPLLLIGHAVSARIGDAVFDIQPSYTQTVGNLIASGAQGTQLALLAPGWLHGCLGLWISLRRFEAMQRAKPLLIAIVVLLPVAAAIGFLRMSAEVAAFDTSRSAPPDLVANQTTLRAWSDQAKNWYLIVIFAAFFAGRARDWMTRKA